MSNNNLELKLQQIAKTFIKFKTLADRKIFNHYLNNAMKAKGIHNILNLSFNSGITLLACEEYLNEKVRFVYLHDLVKLCECLGVSMDYFFNAPMQFALTIQKKDLSNFTINANESFNIDFKPSDNYQTIADSILDYMPVPQKVIDRFWIKVNKTNDCWLWTGTTTEKYKKKNNKGEYKYKKKNKGEYGKYSIYGKTLGASEKLKNFLAHRMSYELIKGKISQGMMLCHTCDNPICVNPDHLFEGTAVDNNRDAMIKGRVEYKGNALSEIKNKT